MRKFFKKLRTKLRGQERRDAFVTEQLGQLSPGSHLLDAGCGSQRYRSLCSHLKYRSQDFGQYTKDQKKMLGSEGAGGNSGYEYGPLDYVGDVWNVQEEDGVFDAVLCTEVFEHIPYPIDAAREFSRLLRKGGTLILTFPGVSLRHFDPYYFYVGFSDRWVEKILPECGFSIVKMERDGDYYGFMSTELKRMFVNGGVLAKFATVAALAYTITRPKTSRSIDTLSEGLFIVAKKI